MPASPPITSGLSIWLCSETNLDLRPDGSLVSWTSADGTGVRAVSIGSSRPQWIAGQFNGFPVVRFNGNQGLFLEAGILGQDNFTLIAIGKAAGTRATGGAGISGQKMLFYQDGSSALTHLSVSLGLNGVGVYEFGGNEHARAEAEVDASCFCPLVVSYEGRFLNVYLGGNHLISDGSAPAQAVDIPHGIGGTGGVEGGFEGDIAEVLIYNRALAAWERQAVEEYLQAKYNCGPSSSSSSEDYSSSSSYIPPVSSSESHSSEIHSSSSEPDSSLSSLPESSSSDSNSSSYISNSSSYMSNSSSYMSESSASDMSWPVNPVPVTDGLVAWLRSDVGVMLNEYQEVLSWGPAASPGLPGAQLVATASHYTPDAFCGFPAIRLSGIQGFRFDWMTGVNSFTMIIVAKAAAGLQYWLDRALQPMLIGQDMEHQQQKVTASLALGNNGVAIFEYESEYQTSINPRIEAPCGAWQLPLVVCYENKSLSLYSNGSLLGTSGTSPAYDIWVPAQIGSNPYPSVGCFVGDVAEVIIYDRALSPTERQMVEQYVQERYALDSSSSEEESSSSDMSSSSDRSSSSYVRPSSSQPPESSSEVPPYSSSSSSEYEPPVSSEMPSSQNPSSENPSSEVSSYSDSSEVFYSSESDSDSSSSVSSEAGIRFTESELDLFNPVAEDYDWTPVGIVNNTGKPVASVEFIPGSSASAMGFAEANDDAPLTLEATVPHPDTVNIKALAWGLKTKYGKVGAGFTAKFKDSAGKLIGAAAISLKAKATLRGSLEETIEQARFNPEFSAAMSLPFKISTQDLQLENPSAPILVEFAIKDEIERKNALFKAALTATILGLENVSVPKVEGSAGIEFETIQAAGVTVSTYGDFQAGFAPGSNPPTSFSLEGGVVFKSKKSDGIVFGLDSIRIGIQDNKSTPPGQFEIQLQMGGAQSTFKALYNTK